MKKIRIWAAAAASTLCVSLFMAGCQGGTGASHGVAGSLEFKELRRYCIARHGGVGMDAIDIYAGRLSAHCSRWAYRQVRASGR